MYCKYCGKENEADARFCQNCGKELEFADIDNTENESNEIESDSIRFANELSVEKALYNQRLDRIQHIAIAVMCVALLVGGVFFYNYFFVKVSLDECISMDMSDVKKIYGLKKMKLEDMSVSAILEGDGIMVMDLNADGVADTVGIDGNAKYTLCDVHCGVKWSEVKYQLSSDYAKQMETEEYNTDTKKINIVKNFVDRSSGNLIKFTVENGKVIKILMADGDCASEMNDTMTGEEDEDFVPSPEPTLAPTPIPVVTPYYSYNDNDYYDDDYDDDSEYEENYLLPSSQYTKLTKSDLEGLSKEELRIARNEIYARHGRIFNDAELQEYFDAQEWYEGYIEPEDFVDSEELSEVERRNAKFIQKYE